MTDCVAFVRELSRDRIAPEQALRRLEVLRGAGVDADLVWEHEPYDGTVHFDLLVHEDAGTLSISYAPDTGLPWPLRGAHRWSDADLLRVDGTVVKVARAIQLLDFVWEEREVGTRLVDSVIIDHAIEVRTAPLAGEDLQRAVDEFRLDRGLGSVADTEAWMDERGLSLADLERMAEREARARSVVEAVVAERLDGWLAANRGRYDAVRAVVRRAPSRDEAVALRQALVADPGAAALEAFAAGESPLQVLRSEVTGAAGVGDGFGPIADGDDWLVGVVLATSRVDPADPAVREACFGEWLAERRRAARIAWSWGPGPEET